jgi:FKBP-type peptidyl-prolyl cis-trans isomerase
MGETIFDSSFNMTTDPTALKSPLNGSENMIQGWLEGIEGMHIGGIREITIPSVLGYGENAQGSIPANSPLKFIIMLIEKPEHVEVSDELEKLALELYGVSLRNN